MQNSYIPPTERGGRNQGYAIAAIPREAGHIDRRGQPHLAESSTDQLIEPISFVRTDALLEPRSASITSIPAFCVQARGRAAEARAAITGFADWSQFWWSVDRRM
jgi:hypothetical protein